MIVGYLFIGLAAGILGGMLGIGGGTIVVPALVFFYGLTQHQAQGTLLAASIPPVFILAVIKYYQNGNVDIRAALLIALGIFIGSFFGAKITHTIPDPVLKKGFAVFLLFVAAQLFLSK
jgi:uncharacterized membrane protein YfcA